MLLLTWNDVGHCVQSSLKVHSAKACKHLHSAAEVCNSGLLLDLLSICCLHKLRKLRNITLHSYYLPNQFCAI